MQHANLKIKRANYFAIEWSNFQQDMTCAHKTLNITDALHHRLCERLLSRGCSESISSPLPVCSDRNRIIRHIL